MWIILVIIIFAVIILVHEFGHFYAARKFGVKVEEFGLGMPPRAKKIFKDKKGTLYSLNWLPFGGFVKIVGEMPVFFEIYDENGKKLTNKQIEEKINSGEKLFDKNGKILEKDNISEIKKKLEEQNSPYNLTNKPAWQQSIILLAGVFLNFVLAFIILTIGFFVGIKPIGINSIIPTDTNLKLIPNVEQSIKSGFLKKENGALANPLKNSIAQKSGLKKYDLITEINSKKIKDPEDVIKILKTNKNKEVVLTIKRPKIDIKKIDNLSNKENFKIINLKIKTDKDGKIGTYIMPKYEINNNFVYKYSLLDSIKYGFLETANQTKFTFEALGDLVKKIFVPKNSLERKQAIDSMSGPVGIVYFMDKLSYKGIGFLIIIGALISINLGVMNILPIPALDGGRFFLVVVNEFFRKIFRKKIITPYAEAMIHSFFFIILLTMIFFITYNDILKIQAN